MATVDNEDNYPLVESIIFADYIRSGSGSFQSDWHFADKPFIDSENEIETEFSTENITAALPYLL